MDRNTNPFNPGAGVTPPELAGRGPLVADAVSALERTKRGKHAKSLMITGLRGVGKTVLLTTIKREAESRAYLAEMLEAQDGQRIGEMLAPVLRGVLLELDRMERTVDAVKRGLRVLRSFIGTLTVAAGGLELTIDPELGRADSGNLEHDLKDLLVAVGQAAKALDKPVVILVDELQYLSKSDLAALIRAMHAVNQEALPLLFFGAGLPQLAGQAGEAKSYAERLFDFPILDRLEFDDAVDAIRTPIEEEGATISDDALREIYEQTSGYPYFLQEWGYNAWNLAEGTQIDAGDAQAATVTSIRKLDESFFRVRFDRLTPAERDYMRQLAELGEGSQRSSDVAERLGRNINALGPVRDALIKKGMIYSPRHGLIAFTVPLFGDFMKRAMP
jgi:type II secretory pathway predicted ATPase ExeA